DQCGADCGQRQCRYPRSLRDVGVQVRHLRQRERRAGIRASRCGPYLTRIPAVGLRIGESGGDQRPAVSRRVGSAVLAEWTRAAGGVGEITAEVVEFSQVPVVTEVPDAVVALAGDADAVKAAVGDTPEGVKDGAVRRDGAAAAGGRVAVTLGTGCVGLQLHGRIRIATGVE